MATNEREAFLQIIAETPEDEVVRKVYADWLDEHDEPEEAEFMRKWSLEAYHEAMDYMENFADRLNDEQAGYYDTPDYDGYTCEQLVAAATKHMETGNQTIVLGFDTPEFCYRERERFWDSYELITSRRVQNADTRSTLIFRCAC